jgi:hypothetical protein
MLVGNISPTFELENTILLLPYIVIICRTRYPFYFDVLMNLLIAEKKYLLTVPYSSDKDTSFGSKI